jgi:hypothetical protein
MRAFVVPAIALLLTGCATTSNTDTPTVEEPSGKPVTVRASQAGVKSFIQGEMINAGYSIRKDSGSEKDKGSELSFSKPLGGPAEWGYVISYSLTEKPPTVCVVAEPRAVQNFGTPNEIDYTKFSSYGERAKAQAAAVLSGLQHKFGGVESDSCSAPSTGSGTTTGD